MTRAVPHGTRVHLVIHTTSGVEFQLVPDKDGEPDLARPITGRMYICDEGDDEAEDEAREALLRRMRERGMILVGEAWS